MWISNLERVNFLLNEYEDFAVCSSLKFSMGMNFLVTFMALSPTGYFQHFCFFFQMPTEFSMSKKLIWKEPMPCLYCNAAESPSVQAKKFKKNLLCLLCTRSFCVFNSLLTSSDQADIRDKFRRRENMCFGLCLHAQSNVFTF